MIYLDHNATTPIAPEVAEAMVPFLRGGFANPSSPHVLGREVRGVIDGARREVATLLGASPEELVFTGGGTESNNHALRGAVWAERLRAGAAGEPPRDRLVTSAVEHPAVLEVCVMLARREGLRLTVLPVDRAGQVKVADLRAALDETTLLVSVMHANNEVGTLQPIAELAAEAHAAGALFHCDAAQSIGKVPVDVDALGVDLLTLAGHKLYAPKGIGALYIRRGTPLEPLMQGAGHEGGRRPGTENTLHIIGLGKAACLARGHLQEAPAVAALRDELEALLVENLGRESVVLNGHRDERLPNTLSVGFVGSRADALLAALDDRVAASAGAACHGDGGERISSVLEAMAVPREVARGTLRLSLGRTTSREDIRNAAAAIISAVRSSA